MADSASEVEMESDTSSVDGGGSSMSHSRRSEESHIKRIESLSQENRVLRIEIDTLKLKNKSLQAENKELRQNSVNIVSLTLRCLPPESRTYREVLFGVK